MPGGAPRGPDALIRLLYDAALQPSLWPKALDAFGDALGGAVLVASHQRIGGPVLAVTHRLDPAADAILRAHYARPDTNPLMGAMRRLPVLSPVPLDVIMPERDYLASGLFNDVFRQQGVQHAISCLAREGNLLMACGVLRRAGAEFDSEHSRLFGRLLPHLRQALDVAARISELTDERTRARLAADAVGSGLILVDASGRILFCNAAAEAILARGDGLRQRQGVLVATRPRLAQALKRVIRAAAMRLDMLGGGLRVARGAWGIVVLPAPLNVLSSALSPFGSGCALVMIADLATRSVPPGRHLAEIFGLTEAEARLAVALLRGGHPEDIATERGVSIATIRTQLRALFAKTGTHTQPELVMVLGRVPAPTFGAE